MPLISTSRLVVKDLSLQVKLGCTAEEQAVPQEVRLNLEILFSTMPEACESDQLSGTICYARITELLAMACENQIFKTVEHLGFCCFNQLRKTIDPTIKINLTIHKVRPPLPQLKGGVFFTLGDGS